jgi:chromosome segregation ATPase
MLVRALIPVRNGDRDPRAPGDEFDLDVMDAFDLREIGAVEILDPEFAEARPALLSVAGAEETFEDPGLIATLTQERDDARREVEDLGTRVESLTKERDAALADAAELRKLADGATAEILQLKARIAELEKPGETSPGSGEQLADVTMEMTAAQLKAVAKAETVTLDGNETKADLVAKIRAARTAKPTA